MDAVVDVMELQVLLDVSGLAARPHTDAGWQSCYFASSRRILSTAGAMLPMVFTESEVPKFEGRK
jgi:hypothetical protein